MILKLEVFNIALKWTSWCLWTVVQYLLISNSSTRIDMTKYMHISNLDKVFQKSIFLLKDSKCYLIYYIITSPCIFLLNILEVQSFKWCDSSFFKRVTPYPIPLTIFLMSCWTVFSLLCMTYMYSLVFNTFSVTHTHIHTDIYIYI